MPNKMLIDATHPEETRVVVVRGNRVEEFDFETAQRKQLRGNIYLAKVTRVEPSLQAAFIEYGGNRHGFLAFSEIHPDYYQIPVADRQALIEADERAHREAEEESENRSSNRHRGRSRHRNARRRGHGERVQSDVVENAAIDPAQAAQPYEGRRTRTRRAITTKPTPTMADHHHARSVATIMGTMRMITTTIRMTMVITMTTTTMIITHAMITPRIMPRPKPRQRQPDPMRHRSRPSPRRQRQRPAPKATTITRITTSRA